MRNRVDFNGRFQVNFSELDHGIKMRKLQSNRQHKARKNETEYSLARTPTSKQAVLTICC